MSLSLNLFSFILSLVCVLIGLINGVFLILAIRNHFDLRTIIFNGFSFILCLTTGLYFLLSGRSH